MRPRLRLAAATVAEAMFRLVPWPGARGAAAAGRKEGRCWDSRNPGMPHRRHRGKPAPKTTPPRLIGRGPASWSQSKAAIHQAKPRPTTRLVQEAESGPGFGQCGLLSRALLAFWYKTSYLCISCSLLPRVFTHHPSAGRRRAPPHRRNIGCHTEKKN